MYALHWLNPLTGDIGARIDPSSGGGWSVPLNGIEEMSFTVQKRALDRIQERWYSPWRGGAVLIHEHNGIRYPVLANIVETFGKETNTTLEIKTRGIREVFTGRTIDKDLAYTNHSYGTIAWGLVSHGLDKPGGRLPIYHGSPSEHTGRVRHYEKWNLANNIIDKRLTELSNVEMGCDIMFRPMFANREMTKIAWLMVHGTHEYPFIAQDSTPDFDSTPDNSQVHDPQLTISGREYVNKVWYTGAGEGEGIVRVSAENLDDVANGYVFREVVLSDSDQADPAPLQAKANGALKARSELIDQLTLTFPATSNKTPLGSFHVGDIARVTFKHWKNLKQETTDMRIIKMSGDLGNLVTLDFQEAAW